jgi:putative FmdB family regulatory protein
MPTYAFHCTSCGHDWEEVRRMANSSDPCNCPSCSTHGNHRQISLPSIKTTDTNNSFTYKLGSNMEQAHRIRREHQAIYGKHEEYVTPGSHRMINPESITVTGDVGTKADKEAAINRKVD